MNRFIAVSLSIIILITLCSCGTKNVSGESPSSSAQPSIEEKQNTVAATAESSPVAEQSKKEIQIKITPPSGWEPIAGSVLPVQYMKETASFMVKKEEFFQSKTIDDVVKEAKGIFESTFDGVAYAGETQSITVSGNDARKMIFTCKVSGMQMKYEYVYLFAGGAVYAITFGGLQDTFDSLSADYEQILTDIRFE